METAKKQFLKGNSFQEWRGQKAQGKAGKPGVGKKRFG